MLTTEINLDLNSGEYSFDSSPQSCSDYSSNSPVNLLEFHSDEDILHCLSSDLDVPLFLNSGDDDINILNSYLDKSTDEILSGMSLPLYSSETSQKNGVIVEKKERNFPDFDESLSMDKSNLSCSSDMSCLNNEDSYLSSLSKIDNNNISQHYQNNSQKCFIRNDSPKSPDEDEILMYNPKRISIEPRSVIISNSRDKKFLILNNSKNLLVQGIPTKTQVICLEGTSTPAEKITTISPMANMISNKVPNTLIPSTFMSNKRKRNCETIINIDQSIDPRILKRQQRKIKNRESACLSRKKKRDYLISLENTVKNLTDENTKLKNENAQLKIKLAKYEDNDLRLKSSPPYAKFKGKVAVCMFFLVLGLNLNIFSFGVHKMGSITETSNPVQNLHGRKLLSISENETYYSNVTDSYLSYSMCPVAINQSESARLVLELERWIGKPSNISQKARINFNSNVNRKFMNGKYLKKKKDTADHSIMPSLYPLGRKTRKYAIDNEIQLYSYITDQIYLDFFEAINRQEDTFYVVSFSDQHMLLPALNHNRTRRPKMSLIMPTFLQKNQTHSSTVSLMQIDCEVQDTRLINVDNGAIPQHFRESGNTTDKNPTSNARSTGEPRRKQNRMPFKPYFVNNLSVNDNLELNFT